MGRLCMCTLDLNEENFEITLSDIQRIHRVPERVKKVARDYRCGKRLLPRSGLPSVLYMGPDRVNVIGAFIYGEIAFVEIEGKWSNIVKADSLLCIKPYRLDATYEELIDGEAKFIEEVKAAREEKSSEPVSESEN